MKFRMFLMLLAAALVFGGIFGFKAVGNYFMNEYFDTMGTPPVTITATEAYQDQWTPGAKAVGSFAAVDGAELTTEASGIVAEIHFENGAAVRAGQHLVTLDTEADEAELARLEAVAQLAGLEEARFERLYRENSVSESEFQRRQSEAEQARAAVRAQEARIRQKTIRSPFDGVAGLRRVNRGQYVSAGSPVVAVASPDPLYLNFTLPEKRLVDIRPDQEVQARVDAFPGETFSGVVTAIEPRIRESTRTFEIQATFANPDSRLLPGMFARVTMSTGEPVSTTVIPQTALQFNTYGNSVYVVVEGEKGDSADGEEGAGGDGGPEDDGNLRVTRRFVRTGETRGDLIAVLDGIEPGERVATSGLLKLRNDAPVVISDDEDLAPTADPDPSPANQ